MAPTNINHFKVRDFSLKLFNETEYEVSYHGRIEFRICIMNRTHQDPTISIAFPGINGNFFTNYRYQFSFDALGAGEGKILARIKASTFDVQYASSVELAKVIYQATYWLVRTSAGLRKDTPKSRPVVETKPVCKTKLVVEPTIVSGIEVEAKLRGAENLFVVDEKEDHKAASIRLVKFLNEEYNMQVGIKFMSMTTRRSSYCKLVNLGNPSYSAGICLNRTNMNRASTAGFDEYAGIKAMVLKGRKLDGIVGALMLVIHEYCHALDGQMNGRTIRGYWHTSRFGAIMCSVMKRHLGL